MSKDLSRAAIVEDISQERAAGILMLLQELRASIASQETIDRVLYSANLLQELPGVFYFNREDGEFHYE